MEGSSRLHFVYMTTNMLDGKFYIGKHSTDNLEDGYLGSGVVLTRAIKKHGPANFKREIIATFDTEEEALLLEIEMITDELVRNPMCYNVKPGGKGGDWGLKGQTLTEEQRQKIRDGIARSDRTKWLPKDWSKAFTGENQERRTASVRKLFADPAFRARHKAACQAFVQDADLHRANTTALWQDPEYVAKVNAARNAAMTTPEFRAKKSEASLKMWENMPILVCPHCGKSSRAPGPMKRHHFDRCKEALCEA